MTAGEQHGASLAELLIGLTIGLMVIAAALGTLEMSRGVASSVSELSQLQQQGTYALRVLGMQIREAGSVEPVALGTTGRFAFSDTSAPTGIVVSGKDGAGATSDAVTLSHQSASSASQARDCLGEVSKSARVSGTFFVQNAELRCQTADKNQALIGNVADFQVWYRVRSGADATQRLTANQLTTPEMWAAVKSVEVCLHLRGTSTNHPGSGKFSDCATTEASRDGRLHVVFRNLFDLRAQGI